MPQPQDGVTPKCVQTPDGVSPGCVQDFVRRCDSIGKERQSTARLQDAMSHPNFKDRVHSVLDDLATEYQERYRPVLKHHLATTVEVGMCIPYARKVIANRRSAGGETFTEADLQMLATVELMNKVSFARAAVGESEGSSATISDTARQMLEGPELKLVEELTTVELYLTSPDDLGFPRGCDLKEAFEVLARAGAKEVPHETAAEYIAQPEACLFANPAVMYHRPFLNGGVFSVTRKADGKGPFDLILNCFGRRLEGYTKIAYSL